jgi:two-component system, cell cycle sensor histidine kinase and response regulator CckA
VFERRSDGSALVLRAGHGWKGALIGHTMVPADDTTQWGYTLTHNEPAIVASLGAENRFAAATLLAASEVVSGVTVVIPGPVKAYGVLAAHDQRRREFSQDDVHFLEAIAHVLGTAVERSHTETAFRQAQRMEAVGRVASGVSHDFNNMLTAITGFGEMVRASLKTEDPLRGDVEEILKAASRAAGLTRQLLAFSREQVLQPSTIRLNDVVVDMEKMLRRLTGTDIELCLALDADLAWVKADQSQIEQVLLNLCVNARDAMPRGGTLTIETTNANLDGSHTIEHSIDAAGEYVMLSVTDTGTGMDAETRARIFEPFFTTKPADKGTGLGLATVYGIVKQSGGEIWVYSELGQGTSFKVFLPRLDMGAAADAKGPALHVGGSETILLAEDDVAIRDLARRMLERGGYKVLVAKNGSEAARVVEDYDGHIHLLITDMVMPELNGRQLAEQLAMRRPGTPVLYLSGYTELTVSRQTTLEKGSHFLQKPFAADMLRKKVREVLDQPD